MLQKNLDEAFARAKARAEALLLRTHRTAVVAVRTGDARRAILDTCAKSKARLLVLGPHGTRPLKEASEGTIIEHAIAARNCPVLLVRNEAHEPYRRVLIAVDFSETFMAALRTAESLMLAPADAAVVHAIERPRAGAGVMQAIARHSPNLLVMGPCGGRRLKRALVGSVGTRVLRDAACDVLFVPEGSTGASSRGFTAALPRGCATSVSGGV